MGRLLKRKKVEQEGNMQRECECTKGRLVRTMVLDFVAGSRTYFRESRQGMGYHLKGGRQGGWGFGLVIDG